MKSFLEEVHKTEISRPNAPSFLVSRTSRVINERSAADLLFLTDSEEEDLFGSLEGSNSLKIQKKSPCEVQAPKLQDKHRVKLGLPEGFNVWAEDINSDP